MKCNISRCRHRRCWGLARSLIHSRYQSGVCQRTNGWERSCIADAGRCWSGGCSMMWRPMMRANGGRGRLLVAPGFVFRCAGGGTIARYCPSLLIDGQSVMMIVCSFWIGTPPCRKRGMGQGFPFPVDEQASGAKGQCNGVALSKV